MRVQRQGSFLGTTGAAACLCANARRPSIVRRFDDTMPHVREPESYPIRIYSPGCNKRGTKKAALRRGKGRAERRVEGGNEAVEVGLRVRSPHRDAERGARRAGLER